MYILTSDDSVSHHVTSYRSVNIVHCWIRGVHGELLIVTQPAAEQDALLVSDNSLHYYITPMFHACILAYQAAIAHDIVDLGGQQTQITGCKQQRTWNSRDSIYRRSHGSFRQNAFLWTGVGVTLPRYSTDSIYRSSR